MSLYGYASECRAILTEMRESLTRADVDALREDYEKLGPGGWAQWFRENLGEVKKIIQLPPSARRKKKAWNDPITRRRLSYAAILYLHNAVIVVETACDLEDHMGASYRSMACRAGDACLNILAEAEMYWPLGDLEFPDGFFQD